MCFVGVGGGVCLCLPGKLSMVSLWSGQAVAVRTERKRPGTVRPERGAAGAGSWFGQGASEQPAGTALFVARRWRCVPEFVISQSIKQSNSSDQRASGEHKAQTFHIQRGHEHTCTREEPHPSTTYLPHEQNRASRSDAGLREGLRR